MLAGEAYRAHEFAARPPGQAQTMRLSLAEWARRTGIPGRTARTMAVDGRYDGSAPDRPLAEREGRLWFVHIPRLTAAELQAQDQQRTAAAEVRAFARLLTAAVRAALAVLEAGAVEGGELPVAEMTSAESNRLSAQHR